MASDYVWRGQTQSEHQSSTQVGMEVNHGKISAGAWAATLGTDSAAEVDLYLNFKQQISQSDYFLNFSITDYTYTQTTNLNTIEYAVKLESPYGSLLIGQTPDYFGTESSSTYVNYSHGLKLTESGTSLNFSVGNTQYGDKDKFTVNENGYTDYKVSIVKEKDNISIEMFYTDTDLDDNTAPAEKLDDAVVGGSITISL